MLEIQNATTGVLEGTKSKYTFGEISPTEILITAADREPVLVGCKAQYFSVCDDGQDHDDQHAIWSPRLRGRNGDRLTGRGDCYGHALPDLYGLIDGVANKLMASWVPGRNHPNQGNAATNRLDIWALERTKWAIGPRLHDYWSRCMERADEQILAVQKGVFAATFTSPIQLSWPELYQDPWLARDLSNYRAAAIALVNLKFFWESSVRARGEQLRKSAEAKALEARARELGLEVQVHTPGGNFRDLSRSNQLPLLQNWRGLYSPDGEPYRSLDRTLMNLPGGVSYKLPPYLSRTRLEALITSRSVLSVLTLYLAQRWDGMRRVDHGRVFMNATPDRIKRACELVGGYMRQGLNWRRTNDLRRLVDFLADYPEEHRGDIVGLAEKSIAWHRDRQTREAQRMIDTLGGQRETVPPPIPLPKIDGVRFLGTVEELLEEASSMENCLASYARAACMGRGFYFHVEKDGEAATIEVMRDGLVSQAAGPRNRQNSAARWGARVLQQWAQAWPEDLPPVRRLPPVARRGGLGAEGLEDFDDMFGDGIPFQPA